MASLRIFQMNATSLMTGAHQTFNQHVTGNVYRTHLIIGSGYDQHIRAYVLHRYRRMPDGLDIAECRLEQQTQTNRIRSAELCERFG